jgi:hypothetical protein
MSDPKDVGKTADKTPAAAAASALAKAASATQSDAAKAVEAPQELVIPAGSCKLEDFTNARHRAVAPRGARPEDLIGTAAWALCAKDFKDFDFVTVVPVDRTWLAEFVVREVGVGFADLQLMWSLKLPPRSPAGESRIPAGFQIRIANPGEEPGWRVIREKDGIQLNAGHYHARREDALRFLLDHASVRGPNTGPKYFAR